MKYLTICAAGACLFAMSAVAGADPVSQAGISRIDGKTPILLAQTQASESKKTAKTVTAAEPKKQDTVTERVKRAWKDLVGYKFVVACPAFPIIIFQNRSTCTETGKSREAARAKCQSRNSFCSVSDAS